MPEYLKGLEVKRFAHKDDVQALKILQKVKGIDKITSYLEDLGNNLYFRMATLGNCVRLTPETAPETYRILEDVCQILSYNTIPEIYCTRGYFLDIQPSGADKPALLVSDFVLNNHDESLLYFNFGRAITRLKSGSLKFYIAAQTLLIATSRIQVVSDAAKLAFSNWMRKSELTADRGGLLACQDINVAMTFLMNKAGIPLNDAKNVSYLDYLEACKIDSQLARIGKAVQTLSNCTGWANDRVAEMFIWYAEGEYYNLLEEYSN